ncbi:hypothetical protein N7509_011870 [Penicillium cosmopolitanum]|uniref:Pre-rRNA-processing protein RIX1 n=1 Tax=Penicillium cosmopolitanum TaxID=1131564 RepID=A0A9W9SHL4_9EURO|nr:uncharacterized protein N7509_011870 [Penicillium cosmopolitanum]KAJ5378751.1 hypothetical protein N7509_011870 [Penicillium cosmopolitanum]
MTSTTLRAITHRLTTTPVDQLPSIASFLATSLGDCAELLSAPQNQKPGKSDSDNAVQIHKLKTRLASLLQDRTVEGRWTAVVLVKATVEAGQWEILRGYEPIVRGLIGILAKPDPISTRKMCIITLTRIFHLTYQYPTLVREITTPHLPAFVTAALNLVSTLVKLPSGSSRKPKPNTPFLEIVLHAILELVPRHPTIFRPFGTQLRTLLTDILGASSPAYYPEPVVDVAEQLFASLYKCAPKDKSSSGWSNDCRSTIVSIHNAVDHVFRAVVEQWESVDGSLVPTKQNYSKEAGNDRPDALGLPSWKGIHTGTDRIITLLRILSGFISMPSTSSVALPLGSILDLTSRLTSVIVPANGQSSNGAQANPEISREEREQLWAELPRIHIGAMELLSQVVNVLETSSTSITQSMLEQANWVFRHERFSKDVRSTTYDLLQSLVSVNGPAMPKQSVSSIANVLRSCCHDLLPTSGESGSQVKSQSDSKSKSKAGPGTTNADSFLNPNLITLQVSPGSSLSKIEKTASNLLQAVLASVPSELLAASLRAEIDRTIILTADKDAMLASVLNPIPAAKGRGAGASLMPFLVRSYSDQMEVEALVRPRMPVLMTAPELDAYTENEEDEEAEEMDTETFDATPSTSEFLKAPHVEAPKPEPAPAVPSVHKRTYAEESTLQSTGFAVETEKQPVQAKKARFETTVSAVTESPSGQTQPVTVTQVSTSSHEQPQFKTQVSTISTTSQSAADPADDESDGELPTLNMDSDTDEDEDDDVAMEG